MKFITLLFLVSQVISSRDSLYIKLRQYLREGDTLSAVRCVREFVKVNSTADDYRKAATYLKVLGLRKEAVALLEEGRRKLRKNYLFARDFYIDALNKRDYVRAFKELLNRLKDGEPVKRVEKGALYLVRYIGREKAVDIAKKWIKRNPNVRGAHIILAELYLDGGDIERAAREYELAGESNESIELARKAIALGNGNVALSILEKIPESVRDSIWEYLMGKALVQLGRYSEALGYLESAEKKGIEEARALVLDIYVNRLNKPERVLRITQDMGFSPMRIYALLRLGRIDEACKECEQCDTTEDGLYYCGIASLLSGDYQRADSIFRKLLTLYIGGERANEVLYLMELTSSAAGPDLKQYFKAFGDFIAGKLEVAGEKAKKGYEAGGPLKPYFGFLWAEILEKSGKAGDAFALYKELAENSTGYIAGESALKAYRIAKDRMENLALGQDVLRQFILRFPDSPYSEYFRSLL